MFALRDGEDGRQAENRAMREQAAAEAILRQRDIEDTPDPLQEIAATQMLQHRLKREVDWQSIIDGRAKRPEFFIHLPTDDECRMELAKAEERAPKPPTPPQGKTREASRDEVLDENAPADKPRTITRK